MPTQPLPRENMPPGDPNYLSPEEMQQWLRQEIADVTKALELRIKEATEIVTAYTGGRTSPAETDEKYWRYQHRWGEALPGTHFGSKSTDEQILASIDESQGEFSRPQQTRERYKDLYGGKPGNNSIIR